MTLADAGLLRWRTRGISKIVSPFLYGHSSVDRGQSIIDDWFVRGGRRTHGDIFHGRSSRILTSNDNTVDLFSMLFRLFATVSSHTWCPTLACNKKDSKKKTLRKLPRKLYINTFLYGYILYLLHNKLRFPLRTTMYYLRVVPIKSKVLPLVNYVTQTRIFKNRFASNWQKIKGFAIRTTTCFCSPFLYANYGFEVKFLLKFQNHRNVVRKGIIKYLLHSVHS